MEKIRWREFTSVAWTCPKCNNNNDIYWEDFGLWRTYEEKCECWFECEVVYS